ncbi:MAG: hypothetical protein H8D67_03805 [Deltaproteobacteria bacterium]|nr:hypothetical protein [Deltaproteobacteria bacterium]
MARWLRGKREKGQKPQKAGQPESRQTGKPDNQTTGKPAKDSSVSHYVPKISVFPRALL